MVLSTTILAFTNTQEINGVKYTFDFKEAPKRAVSISQFTTEIMLKLGLADQMIGTAFLEEEIYPVWQLLIKSTCVSREMAFFRTTISEESGLCDRMGSCV
ncbi:proposed F420-0 ABC transporter, periplasmic F420-0 binding protein [Fusobacterium necrophorum subsp. necrophorum]|nr:proposed F420-0 ABC transporter, periplasmic F420-0 binding protein [Fusobacterium necrophorum subsp. necrophorum]